MVQPALCGRCGAPVAVGAGGCGFCGVGFAGAGGGAAMAAQPRAGVDHDIVELLRKGNKIVAIKVHRERYKTSLAGAKDAVERLEQQFGIRND